MSGHRPNLSDPEPRASIRSSRVSYAQFDDSDEDDEHALAAMGISDGFRPQDYQPHHIGHNQYNHRRESSRSTSINNHGISHSHFNSQDAAQSSSPSRVPPPRPSSITKPHRVRESLSLRHDGDRHSVDVSHNNERSQPTPTQHRAAAVVSPFAHPDDEDDDDNDDDDASYDGPSGPSHPYQMYPQNVRLGRTASLATTSTVPVSEQSYSGPRGPTHPYGMYPQNIAVDTDSVHGRATPNPIPVGFGVVDNYQRRLGPEGEEAGDLIGPDGHTEQLPPYTRYPDDAYNRKVMGIAAPQSSSASQSSPSMPAGGSGLRVATRDPEFASNDNLNTQASPVSHQSVRSMGSSATRTNSNVNPAGRAVVNEKDDDEGEDAEDEKSGWRQAARRKIWGIVPCWAIILAVIVLVLMGVILGSVIGSILGKQMHKGPPGDSPGPAADMTPTITDMIPLSTTPPDMPPPTGGEYALPLSLFRSPNQCFNDTTESGTWICNIVFSQLSMVLTPKLKAPETSNWSFDYKFNDTYTLHQNVFSYGMQPPKFRNQQQLMLVDDPLEPDRGPAWAFQTQYNKTVVIPDEFLSISTTPPASGNKHKRGGFLLGGDFQRKGIAKPGDKPWVCYWEHTLLETFIYTQQNNSFERANSASAAASSSSMFASRTSHTPSTTTPTQTPYTSPFDSANKFDSAGDSLDTDDSLDSDDVRTRLEESRFQRDSYRRDRYDQDGFLLPRYFDDPSTTSSSMYPGSTGYFDNNPMPTDYSPVYPQVVKMLERRVPQLARQPPWCRQYEIPDDGSAPREARDSRGNYIDVEIQEKSNSADIDLVGAHSGIQREYQRLQREYDHERGRHDYKRDGSSSTSSGVATEDRMSDCGCLWWLY